MWNLIWMAAGLILAYQILKFLDNLRPGKKIENFEVAAIDMKAKALEDNLSLGREQEKFVLDETERDYIHLKEKCRHDQKKRMQLAEDWYQYTCAIYELSSASDILDVTTDFDMHKEKIIEPHAQRHEIEKRFQELLDAECIDRWNQWGEANPSPSIGEMLNSIRSNESDEAN